ncbi:hypothetical protein F4813DRAFT_370261 [Daldinia decipiens]|uniref:uncharacterized protein n=1 Tax=Daldinia decipiens TaxID=326647 RepID=UPI0020C41BD8|nr:uncharacterized protein F4813DRAFT_370261 [Daldinia decipiens]KAI1654536.1 hypothetical protein F4813DRAFT_370261 [Daldinia decipiens]
MSFRGRDGGKLVGMRSGKHDKNPDSSPHFYGFSSFLSIASSRPNLFQSFLRSAQVRYIIIIYIIIFTFLSQSSTSLISISPVYLLPIRIFTSIFTSVITGSHHSNRQRQRQKRNMKSTFTIIFAALVGLAVSAPLNINLGAYSPALVVGDGAIGFTGAEGEAAE